MLAGLRPARGRPPRARSELGCALELAGRRRQQRVDPAAQLVGRLHALEAGQRLPGGQRHDGRHRLDAEHLRHPGRHVDVDRRQRPLAVVLRRPDRPAMSTSCTQASLRGDHSSTTTGTCSDRTSTSASKLASVTSTPPARRRRRPAPSGERLGALLESRTGRPRRPWRARSGVADASRRQVCHVVSWRSTTRLRLTADAAAAGPFGRSDRPI